MSVQIFNSHHNRVEDRTVAIASSHTGVGFEDHRVAELLNHLDERQRTPSAQDQRRGSERRQLRANCHVRFLSRDGVTVLETTGKTRDISRTGLGFVCKRHLAKNTHVHVIIAGPGRKSYNLTGVVMHSRAVKGDWYFVGVQFQQISESLLRDADLGDAADGGGQELDAESDLAGETAAAVTTDQEKCLERLSYLNRMDCTSDEEVAEVVSMARSPNHVVRRATIPLFVKLPDAGGPMLITLLADPNPDIQVDTADALGQMQATNAVDALKELLTHDNTRVALHAATALGRLKDRSGLQLVAANLRDQSDHAPAAAMALGVIVGVVFQPDEDGLSKARQFVEDHKL